MVTWGRVGSDRRKSRKYDSEKAARRLANALERDDRPDLPAVRDVKLFVRVVGTWQLVARKDGAR
jgi:hypothetical protein